MVTVIILRSDTDNLLFRDSSADDAGLFGILYRNGIKFHNIFLFGLETNAKIRGKWYQRNICGVNQADVLLYVLVDVADDDKKYRGGRFLYNRRECDEG